MKSPKTQRVFVGIKLSGEIAGELVKLQADLADLPARFVPPEDMHLTLVPPWDMTNQNLVMDKLREALHHAKRFTLELEYLEYGPSKMNPRLIWVECAAVDNLVKLKKEILKSFGAHDPVPFIPHITIARCSKDDKDKLVHRPVSRRLKLSVPVETVELFASPHKGGVGYKVLASMPIPL